MTEPGGEWGAERVEGFERAPGREEWESPTGRVQVRSMAADGRGRIYVNVHVGGILRTDDGGATWRQLEDVWVDTHQVIVAADGRVLAANGNGGLGISRDGGETWETVSAGLHARYMRAVTTAGSTVLASASRGPHQDVRGAVYRLEGERFVKAHEGLPEWFASNVDTHCLAGAGDVVLLGAQEGEVFASWDQGTSWEKASGGPGRIGCLCVLA